MANVKRYTNLNEKAITLIALVVTIVILLILAGITITMTLGQNGLFTRAQAGKVAYEESEVREDFEMLITQYTWDKVSEKTDKSLGDYLKENGATSVKANADGTTLEVEYKGYVFTVNKDSGEITGVSKGNNSDTPVIPTIKAKVGDVVDYKPDTSSDYELSAEKSGYDNDQTLDSSYDPTIWKVMEVDQNGNITKLLGVPSNSQKSLYFYGATGYNNGVYLLNDICSRRYKNDSLGSIARNLNIEDIESKMNKVGISARNAYKAGATQYGTTTSFMGSNAQYPAIYAQEKYSGVNISSSEVANGTQILEENVNEEAKGKMNQNGKTGSDNIYTTLPETSESTGPLKESLTCTQTCYYLNSIADSYFNDVNFNNMIFTSGTNFWIASRFVDCNSSNLDAYFGIRYINDSYLNGCGLFYSSGNSNNGNNCLAPVVSFSSGVQVKSGNGTTDEPYVIGK